MLWEKREIAPYRFMKWIVFIENALKTENGHRRH